MYLIRVIDTAKNFPDIAASTNISRATSHQAQIHVQGSSGTSADSETDSSCHSLPSPVPLATLLPQQLQKIMRTLDKVSNNQRSIYKKVQSNSRRIQQNSLNVVKRVPRRATVRTVPTHVELPDVAPNRTTQPIVPGGNGQTLFFTPAPPVPKFRGQYQGKHPVKFLQELDAYFKKMNIPAEGQLDVVVSDALSEAAHDWSAIFKDSWQNFDDFHTDFLKTYWSGPEQAKLKHNIATHRWSTASNRSMESHFAHYVGLARLLTAPIPEEVLVADLIKHFPTNIQALWSLKDGQTTAAAAEFLRVQEAIIKGAPTSPPAKRFCTENKSLPTPKFGQQGNDKWSS